MSNKKKVVVVGGGNGTAIVVEALKKYKDDFDISAIVSTADSGGSSGILRDELNTLPPGDILRVVLAMSGVCDYEILKEIFYKKRFSDLGKLDKHNLGNLFLVLAAQYSGDYVKAIRALEQSVGAIGKVYPSTLNNTHLAAELENGETIRTEAEIDRPTYDRDVKIKRVWLESNPKIFTDAAQVIEEADYVILSPGSLYGSTVAAILPEGFASALNKIKAKLIYIAGNRYELNGETGPTSLSDCVWVLNNYLFRKIDLIISNIHQINSAQKQFYSQNNWGVMDYNLEQMPDTKIFPADLEKETGGLDPEKLSKALKTNLI